MHLLDGRLVLSATDAANFLSCRHKTALDLLAARGELAKPTWVDPFVEVLRKRGEDHERQHVERLGIGGRCVIDLRGLPYAERFPRTRQAMHDGADVIVQAALDDAPWIGFADLLCKVPARRSKLGGWAYEAQDTKLARETRAGTIVQLCVYSELLETLQGCVPERFHVVTPVATHSYRVGDFAAFYRRIKAQLLEFGRLGMSMFPEDTYPEPVEHCDVCRWSARCVSVRRQDDHLSFVAGLGRQHRVELASRGITTLAQFAALSVPLEFKPKRGAKATYERLREQARLQAAQRASGQPTFELLPLEPEFGLCRLPEPRPGDLFLDLEGDPYGRPGSGAAPGEESREYLFGLGRLEADGSFAYAGRWAFADAEERAAFDEIIGELVSALDADPAIHVYHYAPYEPSALKRLMGRYAAREPEIDRLLRGRRFVDLYAVARHAIRAGVERYSIKDLEPFYQFVRDVPLEAAGHQRRLLEIALETGDRSLISNDIRRSVEGYNRDDCRSLVGLRDWLEHLRARQIANGVEVPRPPLAPDEPSENVKERQAMVNALRARLLAGVLIDREVRTPEQQALYLLAYMLDWHHREDKVVWWEYFRLLELPEEDLWDEPSAVMGLVFVERVGIKRHKITGVPTGSVTDRYRYPPQECEIRTDDELVLRDDTKFGTVVAVDRVARTLDVFKGRGVAETHPESAFSHKHIRTDVPADALFRLGEHVASASLESAPGAARDLLLRRTGRDVVPAPGSMDVVPYAVSIAGHLAETTLPIQGPPGSGKTYTGARMIHELVQQGKRVGVTANSHKVIANLLTAVREQSSRVRFGQKVKNDDDEVAEGARRFTDNDEALDAIRTGTIDVLGGTAWLWARENFANAVHVLFVDEAGQMSLANALAVSQAAPALVLLGDPQQLEQPRKASHPDGVGVSALDHVLGGENTMPLDRGLFLPETWRLAPAICEFTSELFYERRLRPRRDLGHQRLEEVGRFSGAGLVIVDAIHDGCRNASDEEVQTVAGILGELLGPRCRWTDREEQSHPLSLSDICIVAPYNAHVVRLQEGLGRSVSALGFDPARLRIGTVDKFQGQEAPVVIYSMATSRPEDAPRGMEFLYSLNRLNVATSRARCRSIIVASPKLFEPECRTPRQMRLANALCRFREMATVGQ